MITERELREMVVAGYVHPVGSTHHYKLTELGRALRRALATVDAAARSNAPLRPR